MFGATENHLHIVFTLQKDIQHYLSRFVHDELMISTNDLRGWDWWSSVEIRVAGHSFSCLPLLHSSLFFSSPLLYLLAWPSHYTSESASWVGKVKETKSFKYCEHKWRWCPREAGRQSSVTCIIQYLTIDPLDTITDNPWTQISSLLSCFPFSSNDEDSLQHTRDHAMIKIFSHNDDMAVGLSGWTEYLIYDWLSNLLLLCFWSECLQYILSRLTRSYQYEGVLKDSNTPRSTCQEPGDACCKKPCSYLLRLLDTMILLFIALHILSPWSTTVKADTLF